MQAENVRSFRGRHRWAISDFFVIRSLLEKRNQNPFKHLRWSFLQKTVDGFKLLTVFRKRLYLRCFTGFWIHFCVSCELRGVRWFKFTSWSPIYVNFIKNELLFWFFQEFVKIWNKLFNDFPEYLPMAASVEKTKN